MGDAFRCADSAEARAEPLYGTASHVARWLLVEQPGSWGRDALEQSRLPVRVARELRRRARAAGVRVVLIRRGVRQASDRRHCYLVRTDDRGPRMWTVALDRVDDVLDLDLTALRGDGAVEGASEARAPVFLVCTHGRHDACCSMRGNEVSRVACAIEGTDVWECSHIGGDRFAANVVCFPHGVYYGRVGVADAARLMDRYARGMLSLDHFRGRSCHPFAVQAAEFFVRRGTGTIDVDGVTLLDASRTGDRLTAAFALGDARRARVELRVTHSRQTYRLTCGATRPEPIPRYELLRLDDAAS